MKTTVVQYQVKPERAAENQQLIEAVFADLQERAPAGFTYQVFRLEDGVSFIHVVIEHDVEESDSLQAVTVFQVFWPTSPNAATSPRRRRAPRLSAATADPC